MPESLSNLFGTSSDGDQTHLWVIVLVIALWLYVFGLGKMFKGRAI